MHLLRVHLLPHSYTLAKIHGSWKKLIKFHELERAATATAAAVVVAVPIPTSIYCAVCISHMIASVVLKTYLWAMNELITIVNSYWRPKEFKWESRWNEMKWDVWRGRMGGWVCCIYIYDMCRSFWRKKKKRSELKNEPKQHECTSYQIYNRLRVFY